MLPRPTPGRRPRWAFTLLELLLCLVVIAFVASFSISSFFDSGDVTLHNALRLLADDIRLMQNRAIYLQMPVELRFDTEGDGYHAIDVGTPEAHKMRSFPLVDRRYSSDGVFEGVRITRIDLGGTDRIHFDERGHVREGGSVLVTYRDETRTLRIDAGRGLTSLPDSSDKRGWLLERLH